MFAGFSKKTGDFLWELAFNNERPWFLDHKQEFEDTVNTPMKALARDAFELMGKKLPDFEGNIHVSRIYRDARRLFGRGPYKDHLWFSIKDAAISNDGPMLWFEIGPAGYDYGMGAYGASPAQMEAFRRSIDANTARFKRLAETLDRKSWKIGGEPYKRPKALHDDPLVDSWYNRKYVGVSKAYDWNETAYSSDLTAILVDAFSELMPMYRFFTESYLACQG